MARCIFCRKQPLTKEHIFPKWLNPYIPKTMSNHEALQAIFFRDRVDSSVRKRAGDPHSWSVKCVCAKCNNVWMGALQERAKPILLPLIRGNAILIDQAAQHVLASWIAMATMCAEFDNRKRVAISDSDRRWLYTTQTAPSRWRIWIGHYRRGHWNGQYVHHSIPISPDKNIVEPPNAEVVPPNTQTTTLVIGQLYIHVLSSQVPWVFDRVQLTPAGIAVLSSVWPIGNIIAWPTTTMTDRQADDICGAFFKWITGIDRSKFRL